MHRHPCAMLCIDNTRPQPPHTHHKQVQYMHVCELVTWSHHESTHRGCYSAHPWFYCSVSPSQHTGSTHLRVRLTFLSYING